MVYELLNLITKDTRLDKDIYREVRKELDNAIKSNNLFILHKKDKVPIGFFTLIPNGKSVLINNMLVLKQYRNSHNLLNLRKFIRERYPNKEYVWKRRKDNKLRRAI